MNNYCELMENCSMECPDYVDCPYDSVLLGKDFSRYKRYHNSKKAEQRKNYSLKEAKNSESR